MKSPRKESNATGNALRQPQILFRPPPVGNPRGESTGHTRTTLHPSARRRLPAYTLTGKPIPVRDTIRFRAPGLRGAWGSVSQGVDPRDRTTTTVAAHATWVEGRASAQDKREALRTLQELMGWILLTSRRDAEDDRD